MDFDFLSDPAYDIIGAFLVTIELTILSAIGSLIWGVVLAGMRVSPVPVMRWFGATYVNVFRNAPLTVLIVATSVVLSDTLGIRLAARTSPTFLADNAFRLAVLGFVVYTSTFVCEAALLMSTMVENESNALFSVFVVFAFGFVVLTLPVGLLLGMLAKKVAVKR